MNGRAGPPVWLWMNLLGLDAPLIAILWQDLLAKELNAPPPWPERAALFIGVWAIYIADRLLDVRLAATLGESSRHAFCRRNRAAAYILLGVLLLFGAWLSVRMERQVALAGCVLAAAVIADLLVFAFLRIRLPYGKPLQAAGLFTCGVFLVFGNKLSTPWQALAFCALCLANLLTVGKGVRITFWLMVLAIACSVIWPSRWFYAIAVSSMALAAVNRFRAGISGEGRRVLADFALFTPLLFP